MRYEVIHRTRYKYESNVSVSLHHARLRPRALPRQACLEHELEIDPQPVHLGTNQDYYGNAVAILSIESPHKVLTFISRSIVEISPAEWPEASSTPPWESVREQCRSNDFSRSGEDGEFSYPTGLTLRLPEFVDYAGESFPPDRPYLEGALDLMRRIHADFKFDPRATTVATPLREVYQKRRGVCQDFAHFQIACLRSLGLPARYVSGYLETLPPPGRKKLVGADASHAWLQVLVPGFGWVDVDPTNNLMPSERHITVAWGRDFEDVSPIRGVIIGGGRHKLSVAVDVRPSGGKEE